MKKIVIASDSFKGSLTSSQVADAVCEGVKLVYPEAEVIKINVADGGEGTTEAILDSIEGQHVTLNVCDPLGRKIQASYGLIDNGLTAVIETAAASGLTLLSPEERNPLLTSTFGTGEMIADALRRGCRKFMIGLGGSATNDGGMGMLSALGYRFMDSEGNTLKDCGDSLNLIESIDDFKVLKEIAQCEFLIACDVNNPLYGPEGAAYVFAPQKGADREMVQKLDDGLKNLAKQVETFTRKDISSIPGSGAAGGLGAAFIAFTNCRIIRGIDMVLDAIKFDELIAGADLIITGEGKIDKQTAMGKVPFGILKRTEVQGIKTIAIGGIVENYSLGFDSILQITPKEQELEFAMKADIAKSNIITAISAYLQTQH